MARIPKVNYGMFQSDDVLGYVHRPRLLPQRVDAGADSFQFATDEHGFRVSCVAPPSSARDCVLALGAGETFGWGVEFEDTFAARVGQALNLRVYNAAILHHSGASAVRLLERYAQLKPRVILYGESAPAVQLNLLEHRVFGEFPADVCWVKPLPSGSFEIQNAEDPGLGFRLIAASANTRTTASFIGRFKWKVVRASMHFVRSHSVHEQVSSTDRDDLAVEAECFVLRRLLELSNSIGARLVVVHIPQHVLQVPADARIQLAVQDQGAIFIDLATVFLKEEGRGGTPKFSADGSMNAEGHRITADQIIKEVTRLEREAAQPARIAVG